MEYIYPIALGYIGESLYDSVQSGTVIFRSLGTIQAQFSSMPLKAIIPFGAAYFGWTYSIGQSDMNRYLYGIGASFISQYLYNMYKTEPNTEITVKAS